MKNRLHKGAIGLALLGAGILAGSGISTVPVAQGEVRTGPPSQALQSGGQLSLPILQDIAGTLRQIDSRLARLETVAQKLQSARPAAPGSN
jgi:hypothetical protein